MEETKDKIDEIRVRMYDGIYTSADAWELSREISNLREKMSDLKSDLAWNKYLSTKALEAVMTESPSKYMELCVKALEVFRKTSY
jgi:hypothetical protein